MQHLLNMLLHAWADSTKEMYGSSLLTFHTFCDFKSIPEAERAPVATDIMSTFIAHLAGAYAPSTVVNYVSTVQAWHEVHRLKWSINEWETELLYKVARNLAPSTSKRPMREPYTLATIATIQQHLDLTLPLHAVVFTPYYNIFRRCSHRRIHHTKSQSIQSSETRHTNQHLHTARPEQPTDDLLSSAMDKEITHQ